MASKLKRAAAAASGPDPKALLERAAALVPKLRERAAATEQARRIPAESIAELRAAGLFRVLQPARFGGFEQDFAVFARLVAELARGCGSSGWVYGVCALHQWVVGTFSPLAQDEVWGPDPDTLVSGSYAPSAKAEPVAGGYAISGTWGFASGCDHSSWHLVGAHLPPEKEGGPPVTAFLLVPRSDYRIVDNWYTVGLCGTGSKDVAIESAFVPTHRVVTYRSLLTGSAPGAAVNRNPLYQIPFLTVVPSSIAPTAFGIVQDSLDEFIEIARVRRTKGGSVGGGSRLAEFPIVQSRIAEASGCLDAARLLVARDLTETMTTAMSGEPISVAMRLRNRRDYALAVRLCVQAIDALYACAGGAGLFSNNRIQRAWRDVHAVAMHIGLNWDAISAMYGQHALGLDPKGQF